MTLKEYTAKSEKYKKLLETALAELGKAFDNMINTTGAINLPLAFEPITFRKLVIEAKYGWLIARFGEDPLVVGQSPDSNSWLAERFIKDEAEYQPARILECLRKIQAATTKCYKEVEKRRKEAEKLLKEQKHAIEELESELALLEMLEGKAKGVR